MAYEYAKSRFGNSFSPKNIQGKQVNILFNDCQFLEKLDLECKELWLSFGKLVRGFLGKHRDPNYKKHVRTLMTKLKKHEIRMTLKIHLLRDHLDRFPSNCSDFSDEAGERFHQDVKESARRTKNQPLTSFINDYCWRLMRDKETNRPRRRPNSKLYFS